MRKFYLFVAILVTAASISAQSGSLSFEGEKHLKNIRQLTNTGENAEAYFSPDGKKLIFQSKHGNMGCDQIFTMNIDGSDMKMVSTGKGRTTCSFFFKSMKKIIYSSTHLGSAECPPNPDFSKGYVWAIYPDYEVFRANPDGSGVKNLTNSPGYDAEATVSPDGKTIVFTSTRDGDLDIYTMDRNGKHVKRLTTALGYDGGPFFSPDGKKIVYRSYHPKTDAEIARYKDRLANDLIEPNNFEIWVMDKDGSNKVKLTDFGAASFAPYFHPSGKKIIFSSNHLADDPRKRNFDLLMIDVDGKNLERVTTYDSFDGFPMFSPDGKKLVFASNRNATTMGDTNVFIADWVD
ncbi:MAG: hypothetical protein R2684_02850 [Pyrinomonadaceae bacterium]